MGNVHVLPGVNHLEALPGSPRPDISELLRSLADRADAGEIESVVLVAIGPECGIFDLVSTPELNFYEMLGALEAIKPVIIERRLSARRVTERECNPQEPS